MKPSFNALALVTACSMLAPQGIATAQTSPSIPLEITTPDRVQTRIGTLEFKDGAPSLTVSNLDGLVDALANAGYRVVGINFRGSGKSTGSSSGVTLQTMADDVAGVVKTLKFGPVHIPRDYEGGRT